MSVWDWYRSWRPVLVVAVMVVLIPVGGLAAYLGMFAFSHTGFYTMHIKAPPYEERAEAFYEAHAGLLSELAAAAGALPAGTEAEVFSVLDLSKLPPELAAPLSELPGEVWREAGFSVQLEPGRVQIHFYSGPMTVALLYGYTEDWLTEEDWLSEEDACVVPQGGGWVLYTDPLGFRP